VVLSPGDIGSLTQLERVLILRRKLSGAIAVQEAHRSRPEARPNITSAWPGTLPSCIRTTTLPVRREGRRASPDDAEGTAR
jgi:hypothetical protein